MAYCCKGYLTILYSVEGGMGCGKRVPALSGLGQKDIFNLWSQILLMLQIMLVP